MSETWNPTWAQVGDEQRAITFRPAFHRCHLDPHKNYGIGSVKMLWSLRVGNKAVTWDVITNWGQADDDFHAACPDCIHPRHRNGYPSTSAKAMGGAVDWHSPVPMHEGHEMSRPDCPINGGACYLDSGFILGSEVFAVLCNEGDEATWVKLRALLDELT